MTMAAVMHLGLVATHDAAGPQLLGLAAAAAARGWPVRCFLTHAGVRLLADAGVMAMVRAGTLRLDACEHAWQLYGKGEPPPDVKLRSQFQNAELAKQCDRVITL